MAKRDDDQRAGQQRAVELQLVGPAALQQGAIVGQNAVGPFDLLAEILADLPGDEQIGSPGSSGSGVMTAIRPAVSTSAAWVSPLSWDSACGHAATGRSARHNS